MKNYMRMLFFLVFPFLVVMCNLNNDRENKGKNVPVETAIIYVDETLAPIIEDQILVFDDEYKSKIDLVPKSETEAVQEFLKDSTGIIVLTRSLSDEEKKFFGSKKIFPRETKFASDAIALIANKKSGDTVVALTDVIHFMQGKDGTGIKGLVFDNPNSSTVRYMNQLAGLNSSPEKGIYSVKNNEEVLKFVSENNGMIGVIGINWLLQPPASVGVFIDNISVLSVKPVSGAAYIYPSQENMAINKYPLARDLYIINARGYTGLGKRFSLFVAGERGQRIILKSGLLPVNFPGRKIRIRN